MNFFGKGVEKTGGGISEKTGFLAKSRMVTRIKGNNLGVPRGGKGTSLSTIVIAPLAAGCLQVAFFAATVFYPKKSSPKAKRCPDNQDPSRQKRASTPLQHP
jgi:hypothetical protein